MKNDNVQAVVTRRAEVQYLARKGMSDKDIVKELKNKGLMNPSTGKPWSPQTIRDDLKKDKEFVSEIIGRYTYVKPIWPARILLNVDRVWNDLVFWDLLRRGKAAGYELGGLYCTPIVQTIASHVMGAGISAALLPSVKPTDDDRTHMPKGSQGKISEVGGVGGPGTPEGVKKESPAGGRNQGQASPMGGANIQPAPQHTPIVPEATLSTKPPPNEVDFTNAELATMMASNQALFQTTLMDTYALGDQYIIVNPDCTFSIASPETVTVEYDPGDYRHPVRYTLRSKLDKAIITDVYTAKDRTLTIQYFDKRPVFQETYENLIGRLPIVHWPNDRSSNEIYGRPIYDALLPLFRRYDDLLVKTLDGVELLGNPMPVFENLENPQETRAANSDTETYTDELGNTQTRYVLRWDRNIGLFLGKGGHFQFGAPPQDFTKDTLGVLRELFVLMLNHSRIPEFMWGGALGASKASAETQLPPFIQYIKYRRLQFEGQGANPGLGVPASGGILELIDVWLRMYKLINPNIVVGPVRIDWPEIDIQDNTLKFQWAQFLAMAGYIDGEEALKMSSYFDDPEAVFLKAKGQVRDMPDYDKFRDDLDEARLEAAQAEHHPNEEGELFPYPFKMASATDITLPAITNDSYSLVGPATWWGGP